MADAKVGNDFAMACNSLSSYSCELKIFNHIISKIWASNDFIHVVMSFHPLLPVVAHEIVYYPILLQSLAILPVPQQRDDLW